VLSVVANIGLGLTGWQLEGTPPAEKKFVVLAWPHSSNWDGLTLVFLAKSIGLDLHWMVKDSWVKGPAGPLVTRVGAVGIDRSRKTNMVAQMVEQFRVRDSLALAIPPEGTRKRVDCWKSGFYRIALGAGVPVVPGYLDFPRKRGGLGPGIRMTGDVKRDMDAIRAFYRAQNPIAKHPKKVGPIRLAEEEAP